MRALSSAAQRAGDGYGINGPRATGERVTPSGNAKDARPGMLS